MQDAKHHIGIGLYFCFPTIRVAHSQLYAIHHSKKAFAGHFNLDPDQRRRRQGSFGNRRFGMCFFQGQDLLDLTATNDGIFNLFRLMVISIHHHTTDLSDIFIAWCVITIHYSSCLTTTHWCHAAKRCCQNGPKHVSHCGN